MKVGIVTINDLNNYGNRLQCYAVQKLLHEVGVVPENIYNDNISIKVKVKRNIKKIVRTIMRKKNQLVFNERRKLFKKFNKQIKFSKYKVVRGKTNKKIDNYYDYFLVGSDQVWNPQFNTTSDADFLTFTSDNKKIAFSASFGVGELKKDVKREYKEKLAKFKYLSVREDSGKRIIEDLTDRKDVEVLLDPTMMLSSEEWDRVLKHPIQLKNNIQKKYILNYFLGEIPKEWSEEIEKIAKQNECEIINILDKKSEFYMTGPSEFLYLEKNALLICTDSFHSCVFAIIYNVPFITFNRIDTYQSMNSRLDTLLSRFNLENRRFKGKITEDLLKCNYEHTKDILDKEKDKSIKFLNNIFK